MVIEKPITTHGLRLEQLRSEVAACTKCRLHEGRTRTVFGRGSLEPIVVFLGEGPGAEEDARGEPFVGAAGKLLDKMTGAMGLAESEFYILNAVKCRPPENRKPKPDELAACTPYMREQIERLSPRVVVALGSTALQAITGETRGVTKVRGTWYDLGPFRVMPTFHPSYLFHVPSAKKTVWEDLQEALRFLGRIAPTQKAT